jgi:hypothetical protein
MTMMMVIKGVRSRTKTIKNIVIKASRTDECCDTLPKR